MAVAKTDDRPLSACHDLLDAVAAPVLVLDAEGRLLFCNRPFYDVSRYSPNALIGRLITDVFLEGTAASSSGV